MSQCKTIVVEFSRIEDSGFYGGPDRWCEWWVIWDWDELKSLIAQFGMEARDCKSIFALAELFGSGSVLTIGGLSGKLIEPENLLDLRYPSGQVMEKSWQWIWRPYPLAKEIIDNDINIYQRDPERFFEAKPNIFKWLVALIETDYGQSEVSVNDIPLRRLPGIVKQGLVWRIENHA